MHYLRRILVLALLVGGTAVANAQPINNEHLRASPTVLKAFHSVVAKPSLSVVRILCDGKDAAFGTVVAADGWIVTKASELRGKIVCKLKDGKEYEAKVVGKEKEFDLAMLKIDAKGLVPVEWRHSKDATVGRWVASVGITTDPVAIGVVSVATRKFKLGDQPPKNANANAGWLGIGLEESPLGAKISSIMGKSPAQAAGLRVNDIVLEAAGRKVIDNESLINTIQRLKPKDQIALKIKRGDEELELKATLGQLPKEMLGNPQERMGSILSNRRGGFPVILQHDTVLKPSDCGGPLCDLDGKAVGINISRAGRTESYAIPAEEVEALLVDLKSGKFAPKDDNFKVEPLPKSANLLKRSANNLNANDKLDKARKGMAPKRFMKVEEVTLSAGATYTIDLESTEFDTYLLVEDAKGNVLAEDDDSGGDLNAKVVFRAPNDGIYRIVITSYQPNAVGNYTLTIRTSGGAGEKK